MVPIPGGVLLRHRDTKGWSHGMTNVSIIGDVPINFFIKLGFVSVYSSRETYFVDVPRRRYYVLKFMFNVILIDNLQTKE